MAESWADRTVALSAARTAAMMAAWLAVPTAPN
jgi:hypothetical protein